MSKRSPKKPPLPEPEPDNKDFETLFPEREVYGFTLRPWTYDQFVSILPELLEAADKIKDKNIKLSDLNTKSEEDILKFLARFMPLLPAVSIVSKTLDKPVEDVKNWEFDKVASLFLVIMIQNAARIKNSFGLGMTAVRTMVKAG